MDVSVRMLGVKRDVETRQDKTRQDKTRQDKTGKRDVESSTTPMEKQEV